MKKYTRFIFVISLMLFYSSSFSAELKLRCEGYRSSKFSDKREDSINLTIDTEMEKIISYESIAKLVSEQKVYKGITYDIYFEVSDFDFIIIEKVNDAPNKTVMTWLLKISRLDGKIEERMSALANGKVIHMGSFQGVCKKLDDRKF